MVVTLQARVNEDLVMYEVFPHQNDGAAAARQTHLQLRFKKYSHGLVVKEKRQTRGLFFLRALSRMHSVGCHVSVRSCK